MLTVVRWMFDVYQLMADGTTKYEHLRSVERQTGRKPVGSEAPKVRGALQYLLAAFFDLHGQRGHNGWQWQRLSYPDIKAYCDLTDTHLQPWELKAIRQMDSAYFEHLATIKRA